jgi:hypothetical protein
MKVATAWELDLERLRSGSLHPDVFFTRHDDLIRRMSAGYAARDGIRGSFGVDDAAQVARLAMWHAVAVYKSDRGTCLAGWVRYVVSRELRRHVRSLTRSRIREQRYAKAEWCGSSCADRPDPGYGPDELVGAMRRYRRVIGSLDGESANVVMQIAEGVPLRDVVQTGVLEHRSYWSSVKRVHSSLRRAQQLAEKF